MSTTWKLITFLVAMMICCESGSAWADVLLSPTDSIATLNRSGSDTPGVSGASGNTRDGSGFAGGLLDIGTDPADGGVNVWYLKPLDQGSVADPPQTVYYDLGSVKTIDKVAIWQMNSTGYDCPNNIDVDYATSIGGGGTFGLTDLAATTWTSGFNAAPNTNTGTGQEFSFGSSVSAQYVRLTLNTIDDNSNGHWGFNEFAAAQTEVGDTFKLDFNGGYGPSQTEFDSVSYAAASVDFTQSQAFTDIFEIGDSVTVDFAGNRARNRVAISGDFASQSNLLQDWYGSEYGGQVNVDLTLPVGKYLLTTYHHDVDGGGTAQLTITDGTGSTAHGTVTETAGATPAAIGTFSTEIWSNGSDPVELDFASLSSQFGINGLTARQMATNVFSCDFNGANGPTQAGFDPMSHVEVNSSFTQSETFNNVFALGDSVIVDFAGDRTKNRGAISGEFASQSDLLQDWYGSSPAGTIDMDLTLPAGLYLLTTYHHDVLYGGGQATLTITDAGGASAPYTVIETTGDSPTAIGIFSALIRSDGINPVELDFTALTEQFGVSGFTLQTVPEPSALLLALVGLLVLVRRRRGKQIE